jgi:hypothetical protein
MFPPRADSADSFLPQTAIDQQPNGTSISDSPKPAEKPLSGATVLALRLRAINLPIRRGEDEGLSPWKARSKHEETSNVIKAAVAYCCSKATAEPGYIADHTCDGVFAGYGGIVGAKYMRDADRSMRKLVKLMDGAAGLMTVEVWSLASAAGFVLKQTEEVGVELVDEEMEFLKSFARLVERICKDQYNRETEAVRS